MQTFPSRHHTVAARMAGQAAAMIRPAGSGRLAHGRMRAKSFGRVSVVTESGPSRRIRQQLYYNFARVHQMLRAWQLAMKTGWPNMSGVLKKSLASWREAHGFGVLCIYSPRGELFLVGSADEAQIADQGERGLGSWAGISEPQLRQYLAERGSQTLTMTMRSNCL